MTGQDPTHTALFLTAGLKQLSTGKEESLKSLTLNCLPVPRVLFYYFPVLEMGLSSYVSAASDSVEICLSHSKDYSAVFLLFIR